MTTLVLCNVSFASVPLAEMIPAAAGAGFDAVSITAKSHRYAVERAGASDASIRTLVEDHGLEITDVEAVGDWLAPEPSATPKWLRTVVYPTDELIAIASRLGASTLVAVHAGAPQPLDTSAAAFARLCDRAADNGLRVALEYPAWMGIGSLTTAWEVVQAADRVNGGLLVDSWHHRRSNSDDRLLTTIPADRIHSVQLADGAAEVHGTLVDDVQRRVLPGHGDLDVVGLLNTLRAAGVSAPVGVEVFDAELVARGPDEAARVLHGALVVSARMAALPGV